MMLDVQELQEIVSHPMCVLGLPGWNPPQEHVSFSAEPSL